MTHVGFAHRRRSRRPASTRWVLTIPTVLGATDEVEGFVNDGDGRTPGPTVHVMVDSEEEGRAVVAMIESKTGTKAAPDVTLVEVPATWECRGEDGCLVTA